MPKAVIEYEDNNVPAFYAGWIKGLLQSRAMSEGLRKDLMAIYTGLDAIKTDYFAKELEEVV